MSCDELTQQFFEVNASQVEWVLNFIFARLCKDYSTIFIVANINYGVHQTR